MRAGRMEDSLPCTARSVAMASDSNRTAANALAHRARGLGEQAMGRRRKKCLKPCPSDHHRRWRAHLRAPTRLMGRGAPIVRASPHFAKNRCVESPTPSCEGLVKASRSALRYVLAEHAFVTSQFPLVVRTLGKPVGNT